MRWCGPQQFLRELQRPLPAAVPRHLIMAFEINTSLKRSTSTQIHCHYLCIYVCISKRDTCGRDPCHKEHSHGNCRTMLSSASCSSCWWPAVDIWLGPGTNKMRTQHPQGSGQQQGGLAVSILLISQQKQKQQQQLQQQIAASTSI